MKKFIILILSVGIISPSIAQCNIKTTKRPDNNIIKYFKPVPVIREVDYEVGISMYRNVTTNKSMIGVFVLFKKITPIKLSGKLTIQTSGIEGLEHKLIISKMIKMNGRVVAMGLFEINKNDYQELKKYKLKSLFFNLGRNLKGSTVTENNSILINEINCLKSNNKTKTTMTLREYFGDVNNGKEKSKASKPKARVSLSEYFSPSNLDEHYESNLRNQNPVRNISSEEADKIPEGFLPNMYSNPDTYYQDLERYKRSQQSNTKKAVKWIVLTILILILLFIIVSITISDSKISNNTDGEFKESNTNTIEDVEDKSDNNQKEVPNNNSDNEQDKIKIAEFELQCNLERKVINDIEEELNNNSINFNSPEGRLFTMRMLTNNEIKKSYMNSLNTPEFNPSSLNLKKVVEGAFKNIQNDVLNQSFNSSGID